MYLCSKKYCLGLVNQPGEMCKSHAKKAKLEKRLRMKKNHFSRYRANLEEGIRTGILFGKPIEETIYQRYMIGARERQLAFGLTFEQFKSFWNKPCAYCGSPIATIGLDRKDSDIGYFVENLIPCCTTCNLSKRRMKPEEYITHCLSVAKFNSLD